ncbi:MAG: hypothetical protein KBA54_01300 [Candidatus Cloacimonetes bacterium]|nr:hypothetical protein [Candidatus Cloacimonadota bacterium]
MQRLPLIILAVLLLACAVLPAQNAPLITGLNEASLIYRSVPDSLHVYFRNSFGFSLGYKNFSLGMKFIAELPKYSTDQAELLDELSSDRLSLGWKELYASYAKDAYLIHAGIIEESFGSGLVFRSYQDLELDEDYRVTGFKFRYDDKLRLKALYSGFPSPSSAGKLDLAYGADAEYPVLEALTLGASFVGLQTLIGNSYRQDDILGARAGLILDVLEVSAEAAYRDDKIKPAEEDGLAIYTNASVYLGPVQLSGAYKHYDHFEYRNRLQDLPLANHHNETLADDQGSGADERGFQAWTNIALGQFLSLDLDYAEAWNESRTKQMNNAYAGLNWQRESVSATLSYSQIEKVDSAGRHWQKEGYPAFVVSFPAGKAGLVLSGEFKTVEKLVLDTFLNDYTEIGHYEPRLQADLSLGKLNLSLGAQSWWSDFSSITTSHYWPSVELKYPILTDSDLLLFAGREAGGKVCRNGVCRYVAPFSGVRLELATRF